MNIGQKIKSLRSAQKWTQADLAMRSNISRGRIAQLETNPTAEVKGDTLMSLAAAFGLSSEELVSGTGTPSRINESQLFINIPIYGDIQFAAGNGNVVNIEAITDHVPISQQWINENNLSASDLAVVNVSGESMTPRICDSDMLIIDTSHKKPQSGQIYAIAVDNQLRVKRLHKRIDGGWTISSDNKTPEFPDETLYPEQLNCLRVIGKVIRILMGTV